MIEFSDTNGFRSGVRPVLSIIVATTQPWPEIRGCLESLEEQAGKVNAEILIADGNGAGLPADYKTRDGLRYLCNPGASVFQLRAMAMEQARADVVAVTEDHCRVAEDWCKRIITAHVEHPEAAAIGGAVDNGATGTMLDWAQFLVANGPFMAPLKNGITDQIALQANISYKSHALPVSFERDGIMEMLYNKKLTRRGLKMYADGLVKVQHIQSLGFKGSCAINYHNGRSIAGYRVASIPFYERWLRLIGCLVLPPYMLLRTWSTLLEKKRSIGFGLAVTPYLVVLLICHAAGEAVGYVKGAGSSPSKLR
jgi:Glycosyl transferase family 2